MRAELEREKQPTSDDELRLIMRPFYWYLHSPGFQDVYDAAWSAMEVLQAHRARFERFPTELLGLATLLGRYCDDAVLDATGFEGPFGLFGPVEIAGQLAAADLAQALAPHDEAAAQKLEAVSSLLQDLHGAKHDAYFCLRVIGGDHLPSLATWLSAVGGDAPGFILHALDAFPSREVVAIYEQYIAGVKESANSERAKKALVEEARKYLDRVLERLRSEQRL